MPQSRPASWELKGDVRDRQRNLEPSEKVQLLAKYALLPTDARDVKVGVAELEAKLDRPTPEMP